MSARTAAAGTAVLLALGAARAAFPLSCSEAFEISHTFPSGSRWEMCFEPRTLEGIALSEIAFTPSGGARQNVLAELALAQVHVPYDDNGARFHDLTDYGLGTSHLDDLGAAECAGGTLRNEHALGTGDDVVCQRVVARGDAYRAGGQRAPAEALEVWSVSHIGAYNYVPRYLFQDDGTIELQMGATGQLQRYSGAAAAAHGWPLNAGDTSYGVSHLHNYYWRLDFDLGDVPDDDVVEEIAALPSADFARRSVTVDAFEVETKRSIDPATARRWRVRDSAANDDGHALSWQFEPLLVGHRDEGPNYEPFTKNDLYVTVLKTCERFASHNPTTGGCASDVSGFVDAQSLTGADLVVWYGLSFHHVPRDEDEESMPTHWSSFRLVPRDLLASGPPLPPLNQPPSIDPPLDQSWAEGAPVSLQVSASDPESAPVSYAARGLPPGLGIDEQSGLLSGTVGWLAQGPYRVALIASDGASSSQVLFGATVADVGAPGEIFDDTFESGDSAAWTASLP